MTKIPQSAEKVFSGILLDVYQWQQEMFDGTTQTFEYGIKQPVCGIFVVTKDKKIIYLKQEQPARSQYYAIPAGKIEIDEDPLCAVKRELLEETGFKAQDISLFLEINDNSKVHQDEIYYIGFNAKKVCEQQLDGGEKIEVCFADFDEFIQLVRKDNFLIHPKIKFMVYEALLEPHKMNELKKKFRL